MVNQNYASVKCPLSMWQRIFTFHASEFKNICSLAEICLCTGASNSTVERRFSLLSNILTDKRLRISHKAMENCLLVAANSVNFTLLNVVKSLMTLLTNIYKKSASYLRQHSKRKEAVFYLIALIVMKKI